MATIAATDYQMPIGGEWGESDGGRFDVTNPATGEVVGTAVNATADDVRARSTPPRRRSARGRRWPRSSAARILRRAADRILRRGRPHRRRDDRRAGQAAGRGPGEVVYAALVPRVVRGRGRARLRHVAASDEPAEARARAAPARRRHRGDHALELPGGDDDPQARPGARRRLHDDRQARLGDAADGARGRALHGGGRRARRRRQRHHLAPHGRRGERRCSATARVRKISFTGSTEVGKELIRRLRRPGQAPLARARRPRAVRDLRGRRPRGGRRRTRSPRSTATPARPASARTASTCSAASTTSSSRSSRARRSRAEGRQRARGGRRRSARSSTTAASTRPTSTSRTPSPRAPTSSSAASALTDGEFAGGLVLRADGARQRHRGHADLPRGDVRPGRRRHRLRHRGRGDPHGQRHGLRPGRVLPHARLRAPAARRREARLRHRRRQRRHHLVRRGAVRRHQGVRLRPRGRPAGHRRVPGRQVRLDRRRRHSEAANVRVRHEDHARRGQTPIVHRAAERQRRPDLHREPGAAFRGERGRGRSSPSSELPSSLSSATVVRPDAPPEEGGVIRSEEATPGSGGSRYAERAVSGAEGCCASSESRTRARRTTGRPRAGPRA